MSKYNEEVLKKKGIDELTHLFMDEIKEQNLKLIEGIEFLIEEDFDNFRKNLNYIIDAKTEIQIKKSFEHQLFKSKKSSFTKADRLKLFSRINEIKNIGEYLAHKMLLYKVVFPDKDFKLKIRNINESLKIISKNISDAVKSVGSDLKKAHNLSEFVKEERRKMREEEWSLLTKLWNYDVDYIGRTWYFLKELIEGIMMLADHIKNFAEYIQFLSTKYLIFQ
ncbi:MAG: hypothetical protein ACTSWY_09790 [Promethearchaeota archaeon]